MKIFDGYEAVKFTEESTIFITHNQYLCYIYSFARKTWRKYENAGNDRLTVCNYEDVTREELTAALGGIFPTKETDFMRLCSPRQLYAGNMVALLAEDYPEYMSEPDIFHTVSRFFYESDVCHQSYLGLKEIFNNAIAHQQDKDEVLSRIRERSFAVIGRDIFKEEIGIVDGHDGSSYFWIMPVRIIDFSDTNGIDNVAEMERAEISIEEDDVAQYLTPFLYKYFDDELEANKRRVGYYDEDDDGNSQISYVSGFEWNLTHNFYTFDSMTCILRDIRETVDALLSGRDTEYTVKLREKRGSATYMLLYASDLSDEQVRAYNASRPKVDDTKIELIVDFYQRFIYRMEYMMRIGKEKGYNLISFMGP